MYLKQLVLKGFKSFADRSALSFEPGISAVVGPNGSGKSNISDAVLWVLGERNAKNLRGQAMEDVIFAGSSARKPVGVAEVDLVLDNSDGTLPVDFTEVSITRRMYRSGESEYLINGALARRMDVLDILHDTGLGTGTHSIISQGSLDSILQSKPEDRRALIEEAAGVLKHKQRKQKSERKIEQMDQHVARVKDVVGEIQRQLGPLERKAKRAVAYQEASAELAEANLALAVDDLRTLQQKWDVSQETEARLAERAEAIRQTVEASEAAVEALQRKVQEESLDAGELAKRYRAAQSAQERFDAFSLVLREKRRTAERQAEQLEIKLEENRVKAASAQAELARAEGQLAEVKVDLQAAQLKFSQLSGKRDELARSSRELANALASSRHAQKKLRTEIDAVGKRRAETQETLANSMAHEKLIAGHSKELEIQLERALQEADALRAEAAAAAERADALKEADEHARAAVSEALNAATAARAALDEARAESSRVSAEAQALEEVERAHMTANPALSWMLDHREELSVSLCPLSHEVSAPEEFDMLLETLLGADLNALFVRDAESAASLAASLAGVLSSGDASFLPLDEMKPSRTWAPQAAGAARLVDSLSFSEEHRGAIEALLGDVYVCRTPEEALACRRADGQGARFATPEGFVAWGNGKVTLALTGEDEEGALARHRRIESLRAESERAQRALDEAGSAVAAAESAQRDAQAESLKAGQAYAQARGAADAAASAVKGAEAKLSSIRREFEDLERQRAEAQAALEKARPTVEELDERLSRLNEDLEAAIERTRKQQRDLDPLQEESNRTGEALTEAKLQVATMGERASYTERIVLARQHDIQEIEAQDEASRATLAAWHRVARRTEPLLASFAKLSDSARAWTEQLERETQQAQDATSGLHAQVNAARETARAAHDAYDAASAELSAARVEKGRLEVQVQAAVDAIVKDCGTSMEAALELPPLESRADVEEKAFKLRRRIANMGTINPDAAEEYEELKKRYDYLASQLDDLEGARRALAKIVRAIDARMRDDFARTFEQVDRNFQEIFAVLFPGGSASLSLVDPDDMEHTGVEVNAQPRGKRITKMMLMSGGEKSLTALALLFAVYRIRSTPFYILDEVEAALDDTNLRRLVAYLDAQRHDTQLIMITHQRRTMEMADALFGVSMQSDGVTKVVSQKL